jgi:hypothetical protein
MNPFRLFVVLLVLLSTGEAFAQRQRVMNIPNFDKKTLHYGFSLQMNSAGFITRFNSTLATNDSLFAIRSESQPGFCIGLIGNYSFLEYFDLRFIPAISFVSRKLIYTINTKRYGLLDVEKPIESTFLEFPLLLKYKSARLNNIRFYLVGGMKYVLDMSSTKDVAPGSIDNVIVKTRKNDFMYEVGVGVDFYLEYFKLSPELKYSFGMRDLLVRDGSMYTSAIDRLTSRLFYLSLTFE